MLRNKKLVIPASRLYCLSCQFEFVIREQNRIFQPATTTVRWRGQTLLSLLDVGGVHDEFETELLPRMLPILVDLKNFKIGYLFRLWSWQRKYSFKEFLLFSLLFLMSETSIASRGAV